ncbi:Biotin synthase [Clostridium liquoris]|jgi:biotin synthase|uniref:Biotin synthase n=1 Tax=Clostridium liquoris TaxID=1289519 RepID=A0A2T0B4T3_9CLOT|nr:[FeFe] hydrogenase H-cluster radical SAM maturase HydE [Clostridium liquoris]PRR78900.1 Biotin synthase [Clostridium liquoris]
MNYKEIIDKAALGEVLSQDEMVILLKLNENEVSYLFNEAKEITEEYCGNKVQIRAIIEFSSFCRCACAYCGLNSYNCNIKRYRMPLEEIINTAREAYIAGYKTIVLQSGEDLWYTKEKICYLIKQIKSIGDIAITLSIGERDFEEYKAFKEAGADRFLIKHETADEDLYNRLHPHSSFKNRIKCLKNLKELGYQVGSGFMIGLPGQSYETIAKDIMLLKELQVDMAGIGPFIPHPETKLKKYKKGDTFLTLKVLALSRLILKNTHLPATTSLGVINSTHKGIAFSCGANVIMQKVEPYKYRRLYEIYPNKAKEEKTIKQERKELEDYILNIDKKISLNRGDSFKKKYFKFMK